MLSKHPPEFFYLQISQYPVLLRGASIKYFPKGILECHWWEVKYHLLLLIEVNIAIVDKGVELIENWLVDQPNSILHLMILFLFFCHLSVNLWVLERIHISSSYKTNITLGINYSFHLRVGFWCPIHLSCVTSESASTFLLTLFIWAKY